MVPPPAAVLEMMTGHWFSQAMYIAAELGIADVLRDGPLSPEPIAEKVDANPDAIARLLRLLASRQIFVRHEDGRFGLTPMANVFRSDAPVSVRGIVRFWGHPLHWENWSNLPYSVRTGKPGVEALRGKPMFDWIADNPDFGAVFNTGMTSLSTMETDPVLNAYDFSAFDTVVDVGGGLGRLLAAILTNYPRLRGILFDAESVVADAPDVLDASGVADRCTVVGGSFFESVPAGGDAYLMKHIIHDWDESKVLEILRNVRSAMRTGAKLLAVEFVVPEDDREHISKVLDLEMLLIGAGRERTAGEYADLLRRADFRLNRVIPTVGPVSIVEAQAV